MAVRPLPPSSSLPSLDDLLVARALVVADADLLLEGLPALHDVALRLPVVAALLFLYKGKIVDRAFIYNFSGHTYY